MTTNDETKLYNKLFDSYSKSIRPVNKWSEDIQVNINIDLAKVANVVRLGTFLVA